MNVITPHIAENSDRIFTTIWDTNEPEVYEFRVMTFHRD